MYINLIIMKKYFKTCLVVLLAVAACATIVYKLVNKAPSADFPQEVQVAEIFTTGGCISCHSADPELPFYVKIPVAGDIIRKDIDKGYRSFDMTGFMDALATGGQIAPVDLAKIEKVVLDDRMPMAKYYLMHWGSSLNARERDIVLDWVKNTRSAIYNDGLAGERANEPVRPIPLEATYDPAKAALG